MQANVFRFDETWNIPNTRVETVYDLLSRGELLPLWWKEVYLEAERLDGAGEPKVGDRIRARARGFLPYRLRFILMAAELTPDHHVVVTTSGDFDGRRTATLSQRGESVHVDLVWEVTVLRPILKFLAPLLHSRPSLGTIAGPRHGATKGPA